MIVGGGFAGLFAARALRRSPVEVTLVDRAQHHLFQPLLYQLRHGDAVRGTDRRPAARLLERHAQRRVRCSPRSSTSTPTARTVVAARPAGSRSSSPYDDLVVAAGVRQSYFGHDEFARWATGMKSMATP